GLSHRAGGRRRRSGAVDAHCRTGNAGRGILRGPLSHAGPFSGADRRGPGQKVLRPESYNPTLDRLTDRAPRRALSWCHAWTPPPRTAHRLRRHAMNALRWAAWTALAASALLATGCVASRLSVACDLAEAARPYTAHPDTPQRKLLIVGDRTALGTGPDAPASSLAGWIGQAQPQWRIDNLAANGARFADVVQQLQGAASGYD